MSFFDQFLITPTIHTLKMDDVQKCVEEFVSVVRHTLDEKGMGRVSLRLLRPLYLLITVDKEKTLLIITNKGAIAGQTRWFYYEHEREEPIELEDARVLAITTCGFPPEELLIASIPVGLVDLATAERSETLGNLASEYIEFELQEEEKARRRITLNPIFKGRGFLLEQNLCFVLMPFEQRFQPIYEDHIKKVIVEECKMKCMRADDIFSNREIIEDIWEYINKARIVVADVTGKNPNVYYELGIAHTTGKEVIILTQSVDDVPFDIRHLRVIEYTYDPRGAKKLEESLASTIKSILKK